MIRMMLATTLVPLLLGAAVADDTTASADWPHWRGPLANGIAPDATPPVEWDESTNIRWKTPIPGEGSATPIIQDGRIYVLSAVETDLRAENPPKADERAKTNPPANIYEFTVTCLDQQSGDVMWRRVAIEDVPHEGRHTTNTYASASPMTDGERLYVSFGSRGLFCFSLDGDLLWQRDLGDMRTRSGWGEATSPVVHGDSVVMNWDQEDQSFIAVLDAGTGDVQWREDRDEPTTWATPLIVEHEGRTQVITNGTNRVRSYDLESGELIWQCGGQTLNAIPSPLVIDEVAYIASGYRGSALYAIPLDAQGDITDSQTVRWSHHRGTPYVPSPIVVEDQIYFTSGNNAILTCLNINDGSPVFGPERLPDVRQLYASPIAADGRIYYVGRDGNSVVLEHGPTFEVLAVNSIGEPVDASPVAIGQQLYLRSSGHVWCIEQE
ncbi:Outer membrane protein assembly factor BamB [Maioricimonas rarisocia]|uniref:Outer membrane protein assembly factor BamB n=1 Tax=Maioricimonas rarisocia TaxID=2528026 RepID=A0A517Z7X8_9PLAN|nr:PQQ-binding-like beta-propeller repeat protein [Maioricimonas rarisocia]QDU38592.1 Outer membrane protein assembly factor BamB [Maioricimonas rarisocia]